MTKYHRPKPNVLQEHIQLKPKDLKINIAENLILSTNAPIIRAGVMIAKVIWNIAKMLSGMLPDGISN